MALTLIVVKDVYNLQKKYTTKYSSIQQNDCLPVGQICVVDLNKVFIFHVSISEDGVKERLEEKTKLAEALNFSHTEINSLRKVKKTQITVYSANMF